MDTEAAIALERQVWEALRTGDPELDRSMLSADFVGVYPSGFSDRAGHAGQLAGGPTVHDYRLSEARLIGLAGDQIMLCYRADWRKPSSDNAEVPGPAEAMYISSIWAKYGGRWTNIFSQDTPTTPDPSVFAEHFDEA